MNQLIIFCAKYLFIFVVLLLGVIWLRLPREAKLRFAVGVILGGGIALILSRLAAHLYYDPRPFVTAHVTPLIVHGADNGFPSDHALFTGMLTFFAFFYHKKVAMVMAALTILVGIARIMAKVHSPLDISAGWIIGAIGAVAGYFITRYFFAKYVAVRG